MITRRIPRRRGFSLLEMAIVVAIIGVLAALGFTLINDQLPSWRTRRVALELMANLKDARNRAIGDGVIYRVAFWEYDASPADMTANYGKYTLEKGSTTSCSADTSWDVLPVDMTSDTDDSSTGTINIAWGEPNGMAKVSIEGWSDMSGCLGSDIVFSPRGFVDNPASDFEAGGGYLEVSVVNKAAAANGFVDRWTVKVSRAGEVKMENDTAPWVPEAAPGTANRSTYTSDAPGFLNGASAVEEASTAAPN